MAELEDKQFQEICENIFGVSCYDFKNGEMMNFNPMTGDEFSEEQKYLIQMLLKIKEMDIGKKLLSELKPDIKVNFMIDTSAKDCYGYSNSNHDLAITDTSRSLEANVTTFLHELTHEIQKQQGGDSRLCAVQEDSFVMNKMMEAEARLNTTKAACEIFCSLENQAEKEAFYFGVMSQTRNDMMLYQKAVVDGKSEEEINRLMLKEFYKDKIWNEDYNGQALSAVTYSQSEKMYRQHKGKNSKNMQDDYMRRMGLNKDDAEFFFHPENIAEFPRDKIAKKEVVSEEIKVLELTRSQVFENGELVQSEDRDKNGNLISEVRYINNEKVCESKYNQDGTIFSSMWCDNENNCEVTTVYDGKDVYATVFKQNNEIIGIKDKHEQFIDIGKINKQQHDAIMIFNDILMQKEVDNSFLAETTQSVMKDEYGLYREKKALKQVLKEAVIEKVESANLGKSSFENAEVEAEFKALHAEITKDNPELVSIVRDKLIKAQNETTNNSVEQVSMVMPESKEEKSQKVVDAVEDNIIQDNNDRKNVSDIVHNQMAANLALNKTIRDKIAAKIDAKMNNDNNETEAVIEIKSQENNNDKIEGIKKENVIDNIKISDTDNRDYNSDSTKASEEMILDALLKEGKLTKEQEDKILEMAVQIEQKRLNEKNLDGNKNYAEQMIDSISVSKDLSEDQKNIALDTAVKVERMEMKIARLRGLDKSGSSVQNSQQYNTNVKTTSNTIATQMAKLRANTM